MLRRGAASGTRDATPDVDAEAIRTLVEAGRAREAIGMMRRAVETDPENADAWHLLGLAHHRAGEPAEAAQSIERALALRPDVGFYRANLALVLSAESAELIARGRQPEAVARLKSHMALPPDLAVRRFLLQAEICDWSQDRLGLHRIIERWAETPGDPAFSAIHPFIASHVDVPERWRLAIAQGHADRILARSARAAAPLPRAFADGASRRIRVAYLSADFHNHPTMHLMGGMFARHDRSRFEVFAYSSGPDDGSGYRRRAIDDIEHFADLTGLGETDVAARIRADAIDVLIDLKGYTLGAMPGVLALRPAPVIITWLGYPATLGRGLADYAVVDRVVAPDPAAAAFGERLIRMPHCYQVTDGGQNLSPVAPARGDCALPQDALVFACFNNSYKIEPEIFSRWMRLLAAVPAGVLWLFRSNPWCEANLRREASSRGIDPARLVFADPVARGEHLARLGLADLLLDTRLINAHTGASDALRAGVPLITCMAEGFASRVAASVLCAAGLGQLACASLDEYESVALELARDRRRRAELRAHLSGGGVGLPLFDTARFTRNLERAIETAWRRHCAGEAPAGFDVEDRC